MLIFSPHKSNLCLESQETRFLWNIFEAVQETRSTCFIIIKTLGYASCFYTPIKHCCSFFKHYIIYSCFEKGCPMCYQWKVNYFLIKYHLVFSHVLLQFSGTTFLEIEVYNSSVFLCPATSLYWCDLSLTCIYKKHINLLEIPAGRMPTSKHWYSCVLRYPASRVSFSLPGFF